MKIARFGIRGFGILAFLLAVPAAAQDVKLPDRAGRIGNWLIIDAPWPDSNGCDGNLTDHLPPDIDPVCVDGTRYWRGYQAASGTPDWMSPCGSSRACNGGRASVDFNCAYGGRVVGPPDGASSYAMTYLVVQRDVTVTLVTAADDTYRYWIDGTPVFSSGANCRCFSDGQHSQTVALGTGVHRLLIQVSEGAGHWGFVMRVLDGNGDPILDGTVQAAIDPGLACAPVGYSCSDNNPCTDAHAKQGLFYFPASAGPEYFIQCSEWQDCYEQSCPAGLTWDTAASTCNYP